MSNLSQYQVAQKELKKLLKQQQKALSPAAAAELQARISTATLNVMFAYGS